MKKRIMSIMLLGISCLSLSGCEKVEAYKLKIDEIQKEKKDEIPQLNLDEEIILDHYNGGKYSVTFKKVAKTDKRNEFASAKINDVVILDYKFENYSVNDNILVTEGVDYKVYDNKGNKLTTYPIIQSIKYPAPSSPGMVSSGSIALGSENVLDAVYIVIYNQDSPIGYINVNMES